MGYRLSCEIKTLYAEEDGILLLLNGKSVIETVESSRV